MDSWRIRVRLWKIRAVCFILCFLCMGMEVASILRTTSTTLATSSTAILLAFPTQAHCPVAGLAFWSLAGVLLRASPCSTSFTSGISTPPPVHSLHARQADFCRILAGCSWQRGRRCQQLVYHGRGRWGGHSKLPSPPPPLATCPHLCHRQWFT